MELARDEAPEVFHGTPLEDGNDFIARPCVVRFAVPGLPADHPVSAEDVRPFLLEAPPALVKVLPPPTAEVRYYVAGGNVVAVDKTYKVVDSIQIPPVKFDVEVDDDGDEIKIEKKEKDD